MGRGAPTGGSVPWQPEPRNLYISYVLHFTLDESTDRFLIGFKIENRLLVCTLGDEQRPPLRLVRRTAYHMGPPDVS